MYLYLFHLILTYARVIGASHAFFTTLIFSFTRFRLHLHPALKGTLLNTISISIDMSLSIIIPVVVSNSSSWLSGLDKKKVER